MRIDRTIVGHYERKNSGTVRYHIKHLCYYDDIDWVGWEKIAVYLQSHDINWCQNILDLIRVSGHGKIGKYPKPKIANFRCKIKTHISRLDCHG